MNEILEFVFYYMAALYTTLCVCFNISFVMYNNLSSSYYQETRKFIYTPLIIMYLLTIIIAYDIFI